ncbi:MAG: AAA family ATPase [Ignavibacterium sp.]|nr:AAA family ATPase [Ignavibacterium sp.]
MSKIQLSDSSITAIRERLNDVMDNNRSISNAVVSKNIGYSTAYVSQFRNGRFPTPEKENDFAGKVESYLNSIQVEANQTSSTGHLNFAMTTAASTIFKTAEYATKLHKIGVVVGVPGGGKTISVKEFVKRNPNNVLVEVAPFVTKHSFLKSICTSLKIPVYAYRNEREVSVSGGDLFEQICKSLNGTNRSLIADEGENLTTACLEIVRRIHDFTGVGVLLSGTETLLLRLQGPRRELKQLYSRVGMCNRIPLLNEKDVKAILEVNFPEGLKHYQNFLQLAKNNGRTLEQLIDLVKEDIRNTGDALTEDVIDLAAESLIR